MKYSVLVCFGDVRCYNVHLNNGRLRLRSITSSHTGYGALLHTEEGPCNVHKTGRQPSGRVPSLTGLLLVISMIPGDCFGCMSSVLQWGKNPGLHLTIINGGIFNLHVPVSAHCSKGWQL